MAILGIPSTYQPGASYQFAVRLARAQLKRGGFELTARLADGVHAGAQAGSLEPIDDRVNVADTVVGSYGAVRYARHTHAGSLPTNADTVQWSVRWTAPTSGSVVFHVAANAGNDDNSPLGDYIYVAKLNTGRSP